MKFVVLAGIVTEASSGAIAALVASTGLTGAAARYAAVLAHKNEGEVESATAVGFFAGLGFAGVALLMEVAM